MIALGVLRAGGALPDHCDSTGFEDLVVVTTPQNDCRKSLTLQLECHQKNASFLPLPVRAPTEIGLAKSLVLENTELIHETLDRLEDRTQLTLHCRPRAPRRIPAQSGTDWLTQRARISARRSELAEALSTSCGASGHAFRLKEHPSGLAMHILVSKAELNSNAENWRQEFTRWNANWQLILSGGWPPIAFCWEDVF